MQVVNMLNADVRVYIFGICLTQKFEFGEDVYPRGGWWELTWETGIWWED